MNRPDPRRGIVLVTVLWTIALISALAMAAATTFRGFAGIVALDRDRARADALLHAGLEVSGGLVAKFDDKHPLIERETAFALSTGSVRIRLSDEGGRIDVNNAPVKLLASLLHAAGAGDNANIIATAIDTWRQRDKADQAAAGGQLPNAGAAGQLPGAATAAVTPATPAGLANTPVKKDDNVRSFTDIRQLAQIPGMPDYLTAITPLTTVFGDDKVNAMTASADVLSVLPGIAPAQISGFLGARDRSPAGGDQLLQMLGQAKDYVKTGARPIARVEIIARLIDGYTAAAQAVIVVLPHDKLPYRVLSWMPLTRSGRSGPIVANRF